MCDKSVNTCFLQKNLPKCFMIQEMCSKAVNTCFFVFKCARALYEAQEMCNRVVFEDSFSVV